MTNQTDMIKTKLWYGKENMKKKEWKKGKVLFVEAAYTMTLKGGAGREKKHYILSWTWLPEFEISFSH